MATSSERGTGPWTRLGIFLQVAGVVVLAAAAASLLTWLSTRPGLHARWDLTASGRNTLPPELAGLIDKLPEKVSIEIFFRPLDAPFTKAGLEAQNRMRQLLFVALNDRPDKLRVVDHDLGDVAKTSERMRELHLEQVNVVVASAGEKRAVLRLDRDIARFDPGDPRLKVPPSMESFRGEQALAQALLRVSEGEAPRILFTSGHGEPDLYGLDDPRQLGKLHTALTGDGFVAERWDSEGQAEVPGDCRVLAVVDPKQPFDDAELRAVERFVDRGGRLLVAPSNTETRLRGPGSTTDLLARYGMLVQEGAVARPVYNGVGNLVDGSTECARLVIGPEGMDKRHPVTESLWRGERRVQLIASRSFLRGKPPADGVLIDLLRSSNVTWLDLPNDAGRYDWTFQPEYEAHGPFVVAMAAAFPAPEARREVGPPAEGAAQESSRVLALGSPDALGNGSIEINRDLALNAFNWLAARESRLVVRPLEAGRRVVDVQNTNALAVVNAVASLGLPGLCALLGVLLAWRRRS